MLHGRYSNRTLIGVDFDLTPPALPVTSASCAVKSPVAPPCPSRGHPCGRYGYPLPGIPLQDTRVEKLRAHVDDPEWTRLFARAKALAVDYNAETPPEPPS
jgi:hypothetical protein